MRKKYQPIVLLILDGWGIAPKTKGNAIELAKKPHFDYLWKNYPHTKLQASGKFVGLPEYQPGNSEAGHMNIGAGRTVLQDSVVINRAIDDKTFFNNMALKHIADHIKANNSRLHIMGLVSDKESPHASIFHLMAIVNFARQHNINKVFLHLITDGRDSPQRASRRIIHNLLEDLYYDNPNYHNFELASLMGRFYAMDRAKNWERTQKAYECLVGIDDTKEFKDYKMAIEHSYNAGKTDEYLEPAIIKRGCKGFDDSRIKDNDAIVFTNLRSDRARQLTKCFAQKDFNNKNPGSFRKKKKLKNVLFCALTDFGPDLSNDLVTAFPSVKLIGTLPFVMSSFRQLYIAETEKYAHVTYFINGGYPDPVNNEKRIRISSPKIENYANKPEMSVYKITNKVINYLKKESFDFITINFANPDMLAHTGDLQATIKGIEHCDDCLGQLKKIILEKNGTLLITADHGNADKVIDEKGELYVQHTTNPVPFILVNNKKNKLKKNGSLANIAPTIYKLAKVKVPEVVTAASLINNN